MFGFACIILLLGYPVAFSLAGSAILFAFIGDYFGVFPMQFLRAIPQRIFGTMTNEILMAVPLFVFMGTMLEKSKVAEELLENMDKVFYNQASSEKLGWKPEWFGCEENDESLVKSIRSKR